MSNKVLIITQIATALTILGGIYGFYRMMVQHVVQKKDATIELLKEKNTWLEKQLEAAKDTTPNVLLDRYFKRIEMLEAELSKLAQDDEANRETITKKQTEIDQLNSLIEQTRKLLEEYAEKAARVDECPFCQAPLARMDSFVEDEEDEEERVLVTTKVYLCGHSNRNGELETFCPSDSRFPTLDDFEIKTQCLKPINAWRCTARPKTYFANFLILMDYGETEEIARNKVISSYEQIQQRRAERRAIIQGLLENRKNTPAK